MTYDSRWVFKPNPKLASQIRDDAFRSVQEVFELDIKPEAQKESPVLTGTNRRSIDTNVEETPQGPRATLFTQSGYGGYLELGTFKMHAQPYLWPAFTKFKAKIAAIMKGKAGGRKK